MKEIASILKYRKKEPQMIFVTTMVRALAYEIRTKNRENLEEVRELVDQGGKLVITPNHISNSDFPILELSLQNNAPEIAKNTVPLWGKKLKDNKITNFLSAAYNRIPVWPPTIRPTREQREEFVDMNKTAREEAKNILTEGGSLVIFLEGTRSKKGGLQKGDPRAEVFLTLVPNEFVLPVGLIDTQKLLPSGFPFAWPYSPTIVYGKPILVSNLKEGRMVDQVMMAIANLLPPQYRGVYL